MQTIRTQSFATKGITKTSSIPNSMKWRAEFERKMKSQNKFDVIWYSVFVTFGFVCVGLFYSDWMIYLTVAELFSGLLVNNLLARGKVLGIWINILSCLLYGTICYLTKAYGEMAKTLIISNVFNIIGIVNWNKSSKKSETSDLAVRTMSKKHLSLVLTAFAACSVATYFVLDAVGTTLAYIGCITFTLNIVIKYTQMSRYKESWWFAIANGIISTIMWLVIVIQSGTSSGDWSTLPTFGGSLGALSSSIYGLVTWNSLFKRATVRGGNYFAMRPVRIRRVVKLRRGSLAHLVWDSKKDYIPTEDEVRYFKKIKLINNRVLYN